MTGATTLSVSALTARYGHLVALRDVSFDVAAGEVAAVLGPNGAGKSTLVSSIAGLHTDMDGTVSVDGNELRRGDTRGRRVAGLAAVGDRRDLVPSLEVDRYLRLVLDDEAVERAYAIFPQLTELRDRRCGLLSGGESQMLALARALGGRPRALVVDEISQGLAPVALHRLLPVVRRAADEGCAVLLVEQFAHAAAEVADRVLVLDQGRVTYAGPVAGAPLEEAYLAEAATEGPPPTPVLTDVTVGLLPSQRRALAERATSDGRLAGDIVRDALDTFLASPPPTRRSRRR